MIGPQAFVCHLKGQEVNTWRHSSFATKVNKWTAKFKHQWAFRFEPIPSLLTWCLFCFIFSCLLTSHSALDLGKSVKGEAFEIPLFCHLQPCLNNCLKREGQTIQFVRKYIFSFSRLSFLVNREPGSQTVFGLWKTHVITAAFKKSWI